MKIIAASSVDLHHGLFEENPCINGDSRLWKCSVEVGGSPELLCVIYVHGWILLIGCTLHTLRVCLVCTFMVPHDLFSYEGVDVAYYTARGYCTAYC